MNLRPGVYALLFLMALLGPAMPPAAAQPTPAPAAAQGAASVAGQPDVVVLIFPLSNGQYAVSAVYSKQVPRKQTENSIQQVLAAGGWEGREFVYENKGGGKAAKDFGITGGPMSSMTGFVKGAILGEDGSLSLGPFLMGFRDQTLVQVTVAAPKDFVYRGPRAFKDARVELTCGQKEGAIICMANIKDHRMDELTLPRFDSATEPASSGPARTEPGGNNAVKIGAILAASLAAGVAVFLLARRAILR